MMKGTSTSWFTPAAVIWAWRWPATIRRRATRCSTAPTTPPSQALVAQMKAEGREKEIQKELKKLKNLKQTSIPKALAYVSGRTV